LIVRRFVILCNHLEGNDKWTKEDRNRINNAAQCIVLSEKDQKLNSSTLKEYDTAVHGKHALPYNIALDGPTTCILGFVVLDKLTFQTLLFVQNLT
jgi:hypothetical protein